VLQVLEGSSFSSFQTLPRASNQTFSSATMVPVLLPLARKRVWTLASAEEEVARV
jgi:hypothetical protein